MDHMIIDVVGSREDGNVIHIDMTQVTKACLTCRMVDEDERPTTPCPLDQEQRREQLAGLSAALRGLQVARTQAAEAVPVEAPRVPGEWRAGDYVSWDLRHDGVNTVRITGTGTRHNTSVSYESSDGHRELVDGSMFMSLAEKTRGWRLATEEERAKFEARYRPGLQNWF